MNVSGQEIVQALRSVLKKTEWLRRKDSKLVAEAAEAAEPIAIVAMSCRFPGGVKSPEKLWRLLADGTDAAGKSPAGRGCDVPRLAADDAAVKAGGLLANAAGFEAAFFDVSPDEVALMGSRQRLLVEIAWEAFERAGIDPAALRGSATGVFVGTTGQDYSRLVRNACPDIEGAGDRADGVLSDRLSSSYGLRGPAVTLDTGCSSSLVTVHLAAQSLRSGECSLALAGGVTVMAEPAQFDRKDSRADSRADTRCEAFAGSAEPTGWAEGACLLLERLSDAQRNKHEVLCIIRGSAVNHAGVPDGQSVADGADQKRLIGQALLSAGLSAVEVDAVEADGAGVPSGDGIGATALLLATYGHDRDSPLYLGSIKSDLRHARAAAGVVGVIKMVLAMRHGILPKTPHVDRTAGAVELFTEATAWPWTGRPRRAAVSSFGTGGTNAHVILEQPTTVPPSLRPTAPGATPWPVSARSASANGRHAVRIRALDAASADVDSLPNAFDGRLAAGVGGPAITRGGRRRDLPRSAIPRRRLWPRLAQRSDDAAEGSNDAAEGSDDAAEGSDDAAKRTSNPAEHPGKTARRGAMPLEHSILGVVVQRGGTEEVLLTGRLSAAEQPWLARTGRFPDLGLVDLAAQAGSQVGHDRIGEFAFFRPLIVPPDGTVIVKVEVAAPGESGARAVLVSSRRDGDPAWSWTDHAGGFLVGGGSVEMASAGPWPPPYVVAAHHTAHPLLRGVWYHGDEMYVEAVLPAGAGDAGRYGIDPALFDAVITAAERTLGSDGAVLAPLGWTGMTLYAVSVSVLRARIIRSRPDATTIKAVDRQDASVLPADLPVTGALVDELSPIAAGHGNLLRLTWIPITVPGNVDSAPDVVVVPIAAAGADAGADAHTLATYALNRIQEWLAEDLSATEPLVFTTRGAIAANPGDPVDDVAAAAVWGLVRAAQAEYPGRFVLIDHTGQCPSLAALLASGEPQLLVRGDTVLAGRLAHCDGSTSGPDPVPWDPNGTVLITGSAGGLAGELARHLVAERRVRHLLLVSRFGQDSLGALALQAELIAHGVHVTFSACDIANRSRLASVIAAVPVEHPLTAVVHTTGALGKGAAASLTPYRVSATLAPEADGAWHLHELTLGTRLAAFVSFSSISGVLGNPGHAGNAAASTFLDALAQHRAAAGLPATSIAWSSREKAGRSVGRHRTREVHPEFAYGVEPLSIMEAPALFDAAVSTGMADLVAIGGLIAPPRTADEVPAVLRGLIRGGRRPSAADRGALEPPVRPRLEWVPAPAVPAAAITRSMLGAASADSTPTLIMADVAGSPNTALGETVQEMIMRIFALTSRWLADRRYAGRLLVVHTHRAVAATRDDHVEDLAGAAAWGVVRAVQAKHPGRFVLLDGDVDDRILGALPDLIATGIAQFAVREGALLVARGVGTQPGS